MTLLAHKCRYCGNPMYIEKNEAGEITKTIGCSQYRISTGRYGTYTKLSQKLLNCEGHDRMDRLTCNREAKVSSFKVVNV